MARLNITSNEKWEYEYDGYKIVVKNGLDECQLLIDGKVQDARNGISLSSTLLGKLPDGKRVKVTLGGLWNMKCTAFVDHEMLTLVDHED